LINASFNYGHQCLEEGASLRRNRVSL